MKLPWNKMIGRAVNDAIDYEIRAAYKDGYREAAAIYGRGVEATRKAYEEADWKAAQYASERGEDL